MAQDQRGTERSARERFNKESKTCTARLFLKKSEVFQRFFDLRDAVARLMAQDQRGTERSA
ncbi:MAG: hypothetical protein J6Z04_03815 [Clostridia bacterium]|nr:hypothetical protein [Clostridia bacterium]